jgi:hypothetical protein
LIALAVATACIGAVVAYAATRPNGVQQGLGEQRAVQQPSGSTPGDPGGNGAPPRRERLLRPRLIEAPPETTAVSDVQFRFHVQSRKPAAPTSPPPAEPGQPPVEDSPRHFQCRIDGEAWSDCQSPHRLTDLAPGSHHFAVRVFNREDRAGEPAAHEWRQTAPAVAPQQVAAPPAQGKEGEPKQFTIVALQNPQDLYPGLAPTPIPVEVTNPNDAPIEVTTITVAIDAPPDSCGAENFELTPAGLSPEAPLVVPANGTAELPGEGLEAPAIQMLDLPVEQDACRGTEIPLIFDGEARG